MNAGGGDEKGGDDAVDFDGVDDRALHCFLDVGLVPGSLKTEVTDRDCIFMISVIA